MKKQVMSKTARRKLVLRAESVVTLSSRDLTAVAGGEVVMNSPLGGCTGSPTRREPDPGA